jgi:predicted membrane metal-binding protein
MFYTNYQLTALPSTAPQTLSVLRANGLGAFALFLVSDLATALPLQLPPPFVGACDVLSNVVIVDPGTPLSASPFGEWEVVVPTLPPGLSLHVQHASANATAPFWFGATNRLRIDT